MCSSARIIFVVIFILHVPSITAQPPRPHIIFIIADDLGWNDVGFHGSNQIPTPNIDALAYDGLILNNYYVSAICTPSRSALMTGKHPIHTGMQHTVLFGAEPRGLPLSEKLLPEYLQDLGYSTHIVGKWHLGHFKLEYTPTRRGFLTHLGYWTGHQDYFDHTAVESTYWGLDMRRGVDAAWDLHGQYSTDIFTKESERLINSHNASVPMFLYLSHAAVHSGNPYNPLPVPDAEVAKFPLIQNYNRRKYAAMVHKLDASVGRVVQALRLAGMLDDSIIVFTTDNGGPAAGFNLNAASNWPLKGVKNTLWEGGVRGAALLWSRSLESPRRVANQLFHVTDWLPTLYSAAGGNLDRMDDIDGVDAWIPLSRNTDSMRNYVLHNIDDIYGNAALTIDRWKIVKGATYNGAWDSWYGPSGRDEIYTYNVSDVAHSMAAKSLQFSTHGPSEAEMEAMRTSANVNCTEFAADSMLQESSKCHPLEAPCLFNIHSDPCELYNLADKYPNMLTFMEDKLREFNDTAVPPGNLDWDPRADPKFWDHTWTNFGDSSFYSNLVPEASAFSYV